MFQHASTTIPACIHMRMPPLSHVSTPMDRKDRRFHKYENNAFLLVSIRHVMKNADSDNTGVMDHRNNPPAAPMTTIPISDKIRTHSATSNEYIHGDHEAESSGNHGYLRKKRVSGYELPANDGLI